MSHSEQLPPKAYTPSFSRRQMICSWRIIFRFWHVLDSILLHLKALKQCSFLACRLKNGEVTGRLQYAPQHICDGQFLEPWTRVSDGRAGPICYANVNGTSYAFVEDYKALWKHQELSNPEKCQTIRNSQVMTIGVKQWAFLPPTCLQSLR